MKKIRTAVAGIGFVGALHIESLRRLGYVDVVGACDVAGCEDKAQQLGIESFYTDYRAMLDELNPDVVHICTPNNTHCEIALYAIEKGIHVICEKPMCVSLAEAHKMRDAAKKRGVVCAINFANRYNPLIMQMRELSRSGQVGKIYSVHGTYLQDWLLFDTDYSWRFDSSVSGRSRAFADIGSHWIDAVESITGLHTVELIADFATVIPQRKKPLTKVETFCNASDAGFELIDVDTEDCASIMFRFENGAMGSCFISQTFAGRKNQMCIAIAGSERSLCFDTEGASNLWIGSRNTANALMPKDPQLLSPNAAAICSYPGGHAEGFADTFKHCFAAVYEDIRGPRAVNVGYATFDDGLREMQICETVIASAACRKWLTIK